MNAASRTVIVVEGMSCPSCVRHLQAALGQIEGVTGVDVRMDEGKVVVQHEPGRAPWGALVAALRAAGYDGTPARD